MCTMYQQYLEYWDTHVKLIPRDFTIKSPVFQSVSQMNVTYTENGGIAVQVEHIQMGLTFTTPCLAYRLVKGQKL